MEQTARLLVETYLKGKQIAYHRSRDINVNVRTDTVTDTVCKVNNEIVSCFCFPVLFTIQVSQSTNLPYQR